MAKTERIQFRVSKREKDFIRKQCKDMDITISEFMNRMLKENGRTNNTSIKIE